jgi:2-methylcitrate dehydratase
MADEYVTLARDTNQARGIAQYALDMLQGRQEGASAAVHDKVEQFHLDSVACGVSALAGGANAPQVLRREALDYRVDRTTGGSPVAETDEAGDTDRRAACRHGVPMFGSTVRVAPEKAVLACSSAAREWDANGTNFGYNPARGATAGEFGHNDYYPVAVAAAQLAGMDGRQLLLAMTVLDEIRGRLAEVFALKNHKIDHVVHGAIASVAVYGAVLGATVEQIESAIGLVLAHYIPFRAIRAGHQLSDSKGASAAISSRNSRCCCATASQRNRSAERRAERLRTRRSSSSSSRRLIAAASAWPSRGGTSSPSRSWERSSRVPAMSVAMTGLPTAMASMSAAERRARYDAGGDRDGDAGATRS